MRLSNKATIALMLALAATAAVGPRAQADCASRFAYTHSQKFSNYVPLILAGSMVGALAGYVAATNSPKDVGPYCTASCATGRQSTNELVYGLSGAVGAGVLVEGIKQDRSHQHKTEQLLVDAEAGYGKELESFTHRVQKQKELANADRELIQQILKFGNQTESYCPGGSKLVLESDVMADVKTKVLSGWHPADHNVEDSTFSSSNQGQTNNPIQ